MCACVCVRAQPLCMDYRVAFAPCGIFEPLGGKTGRHTQTRNEANTDEETFPMPFRFTHEFSANTDLKTRAVRIRCIWCMYGIFGRGINEFMFSREVYPHACIRCICTVVASLILVHTRFWPTLLLYMHDSGQPYSCIACDYLVHSTNFSQDQIHISCAVFAAGRYVPMCVYNTYTPIHMGIYLSI
jgi:hypothetical protein